VPVVPDSSGDPTEKLTSEASSQPLVAANIIGPRISKRHNQETVNAESEAVRSLDRCVALCRFAL
jgi:hypothetical protein